MVGNLIWNEIVKHYSNGRINSEGDKLNKYKFWDSEEREGLLFTNLL